MPKRGTKEGKAPEQTPRRLLHQNFIKSYFARHYKPGDCITEVSKRANAEYRRLHGLSSNTPAIKASLARYGHKTSPIIDFDDEPFEVSLVQAPVRRSTRASKRGKGFFGDLVNTGIHTLGPKLVDYGANAGANYLKKKLTGGSFAVPGGRLPARRGRVGTARRGRGIFSTIGSLADQFI